MDESGVLARLGLSGSELPGVAAVIFDVVLNLAKNVVKTRRALYIAMMCAAFAATAFFGVSAMLVILACLGIGLLELLAGLHARRKEARE